MGHKRDFWDGSREDQLALCKRIMTVLTEKAEDAAGAILTMMVWAFINMPSALFTAFGEAYGAAVSAYDQVKLTGSRAGELNRECQRAFIALEQIVREMKRKYFFVPPLTLKQFEAMGFREPDTSKTPQNEPEDRPDLKMYYVDIGTLKAEITRALSKDPDISKYEIIMRAGILGPDGKTPEGTTFGPWYMTSVPTYVEQLPMQLKANRKFEHLVFSTLESGMKIYIAIAYQNSRGKIGPWTRIMEFTIP